MYEEQMVYWTDVAQGKIRGARLGEGSSLSTIDIVSTELVSPDGLSCDWVTKKLYWVDSETNRIEVCDLNGRIRKVLVWQDLDQPRALALDPRNGYMYWVDWGEVPKIERIGMDGSGGSRKVLIATDIFFPNGLTLDYEENRMFWTDAQHGYIQSANLDGSSRRVVIKNALPHPFAISVFGNAIYLSDEQLGALYTCDKSDCRNMKVIMDRLSHLTCVHVLETTRQPQVVSACQKDNGGCSHLCLLSPSPPYFSCHCPTGVLLLHDNKTCAEGPNEMLLLARRTDLRLISLDTPDRTDLKVNIQDIQQAIALDYDPIDRMVYWTDDELHAIRRARLDGTGVETVVNVEVHNPDGIAVDWVARNLYWTDAGTDRIEVSRLNGSSRRTIIADRLHAPRAIVLDPVAGQMYWTDWGNDSKIERSNLDGSDRIVLVNTSLSWPNGLAIDRTERRLYWADAKLDRIEYVNLSGSGRKILVAENLPHVFGLTLLGDFVYWTDWQRRAIECIHKTNPKLRTSVVDQVPDVMGIVAVNVSFREGENACSRNNGGCSHLCLYRARGNFVCACPFGMEILHSDGKTCVVPEAQILYSARSEVRVISVDNAEIDEIVPLQLLKNVVDIEYCVSDGRLYWIDTGNKVISKAFVNGSSDQVIISTGLLSPRGIAVDHLARNVYWTDHGTGRIEMARHDGTHRRVLIWNDNKPQALVLIPNRGYMFWSNVVNVPRLERATLDGGDRQVIVRGLGQVNSLTVDHIQGRLYWTNNDQGRIESCDISGMDRRDVVTGLDHPYGLTVFRENIYWTKRYSHEIYRGDKVTGAGQKLVASSPSFPMSLTILNTALDSGWSSCHLQNGGCSHLCILDVRHSDVELSARHCNCASHFVLSTDNRTCEPSDSLMLLSMKNRILQLTFGQFADSVDMFLPIPRESVGSIQAVDFSPIDNSIYWIDGRNKLIRKALINGSNAVVLLQYLPLQPLMSPFDLAVSPPDAMLYWTDSRHNIISRMKLDGTEIEIIINSTQQRPRNLAVAAQSSLIFWTNINYHQQSIECSSTDGTKHKTIFRMRMARLGPIVVDEESKKIFWAEQERRVIESAKFDGSNRTVLIESVSEPVALAIHGEHLYWISKDTKSLERVNKNTGHGRMTLKTKLSHLSDLVIVKRRRTYSIPKIPCNGRCSHKCKKDKCVCPAGLVLDDDEMTCIASLPCPDGDLTCKAVAVETNCSFWSSAQFRCHLNVCLPLESQCSGVPDCLISGSEAKCLSCGEIQTICLQDKTCFLSSQRCDGMLNCVNGFDEENCVQSGAKTQYTIIIIGMICGALSVVVVITAVYMFRGKDHKCAKIYNENSLILVAQNIDSVTSDGKSTSARNSVKTRLLSSAHCQDNVSWSCEQKSETVTLMSEVTFSQHAQDPHPTPVTSEGESSTINSRSSLTLHIQRTHRNRYKAAPVQPPTTPCSTDVCNDTDLHDLSSTEAGFESDFQPHPPTPCSQFLSDTSSLHLALPSKDQLTSMQRSHYLVGLDSNSPFSDAALHL